MTLTTPDVLRLVVAETVREVVTELTAAAKRRHSSPTGPTVGVDARPADGGAGPSAIGATRRRVESVRISSDEDLDLFVRRILALADNPRTRAEMRNGWLRFRLVGAGSGRPGVSAARSRQDSRLHIPRGAVTERTITQAADSGRTLLVGKQAVITPLARDRARMLGVLIEKEN